MAHIIITGASRGIGFETALEFSTQMEHKILAISRSQTGLVQLFQIANQLNPEVNIRTLSMDLISDDFTRLDSMVDEFLNGQVDILINNAGALILKPFEKNSIQDFQNQLNINFLAPIRIIQALLPYFNSQGAHIVNIGSMAGFSGSQKFLGLSAYSSSKGALHALTECLALELQERKIKTNALALGAVQTEMLEEAFGDYKAPVLAYEMGAYIAQFALTGHLYFNGKVIPVAQSNP